jgi:hypothetical protein
LLIVFACAGTRLPAAAVHLEGHRLRQVALGHGADHARGLGVGWTRSSISWFTWVILSRQKAARVAHLGAQLELAFLADPLAQPRELLGDALVHVHEVVEGLRELALIPDHFDRQAHGAVAHA